jgi:hypothetical protein
MRQMGPVTSMVTSTRTLPASPLKSADADTSGKGAKGGGKAPEAPSADSPGSVVQQVITGSTRGMLQLWQLWSPPQKPPPEPQEGADDGCARQPCRSFHALGNSTVLVNDGTL